MIREAVKAVKAGASNYLAYPIDPDEVRYVKESIQESIRMQSELDYLRDEFWQSDSLELVRTHSPAMQQVFNKIRSVAQTKTTVLLTGKTGTGKGLLARLIHQHSPRRSHQFISVHCGAIPDTLLESELFGHEKGAFTGAVRRKLGKFEIAQGGTIFLDEIATITPSMQIKLLQVLQDRTLQRVGGEENIETDVRIIAATNADLEKMGREGSFRSDLYYRLNVFPIEIPALAERIEDIPLLVGVFLKRLNRFHSKNIIDVDPQVMEAFKRYAWPGNIRELENLIERAYILETSSVLAPGSFPSELFASEVPPGRLSVDTALTLSEARRRSIEDLERLYLKELLACHKGRIKTTAQAAGITSRQLHKLMTKYGLRKEDFRMRAALSTSTMPSEL
jgi:DNA-binding NtrC family response regulator